MLNVSELQIMAARALAAQAKDGLSTGAKAPTQSLAPIVDPADLASIPTDVMEKTDRAAAINYLALLAFLMDPAKVWGPWHNVGSTGEPAFQNGYVGNGNVMFRKSIFGQVEIVADLGAGSNASVAFALPAGYLPPSFGGDPMGVAGVDDSNHFVRVDLNVNGDVAITYTGTPTVIIFFATYNAAG